ncbi:MAG: hypothetical protein R6X22_04725, partial [Gemmatimonadota bacterium]
VEDRGQPEPVALLRDPQVLGLQSAQITLRAAEVDLIRRRFDYQLGLARLEAILGADLRD